MTQGIVADRHPVPPPSYTKSLVRRLHLDAVFIIEQLQLLPLCQVAVTLAHQQCPPPLPAGPGGRPRRYTEASLLLIALLRVLWRLTYEQVHDWLEHWPELAVACGLPVRGDGRPYVPSPSQQCKRAQAAGAPTSEMLFVVLVRAGIYLGVTRMRELIIDSAPILAWRRADPDAAFGHAPAHHPRPLLLGYRVHTVICRATGLPIMMQMAPANHHDGPFARPLLEHIVQWFGRRPQVVRLDAAYWGLQLIAWIHGTLGAIAVIPWNPKRQIRRDGLPPTWTGEELGKRSSIERFFGRTFLFFRLHRPPLIGWSALATRVALTYAATWVVALAAWQVHRPDLIRSPARVLAHVWEGE